MNSALLMCVLCLLVCAGLLVAGVYVLLGIGAALIASGLAFLGFALILRLGMTGGS